MKKQQTAVEWLKKELENYGSNSHLSLDWDTFDELCEQAKEIEKEKMIDAIIFSEREHYIMGECWPIQTVVDKAEKYYKKTF